MKRKERNSTVGLVGANRFNSQLSILNYKLFLTQMTQILTQMTQIFLFAPAAARSTLNHFLSTNFTNGTNDFLTQMKQILTQISQNVLFVPAANSQLSTLN